MADDALQGVNAVTAAQQSRANAAANTPLLEEPGDADSRLGETFDQFLRLLTTQMQNQDPLDPLDNSQMIDQLVNFASVEQAIASNRKLDTLIELQGSTVGATALSYLGRTVEAPGDLVPLQGGEATILFELPRTAEKVELKLINEADRTVRTSTGPADAGEHRVAWDGRDDYGNLLPDGEYRVLITALDGDGEPVEVETRTIGRVTGVEGGQGGDGWLELGSVRIPMTAVSGVRDDQP